MSHKTKTVLSGVVALLVTLLLVVSVDFFRNNVKDPFGKYQLAVSDYTIKVDIDPTDTIKETDIISETSVFTTIEITITNKESIKKGSYISLSTKNLALQEGNVLAKDGTVVATLEVDNFADNYNGMVVSNSRNTDKKTGTLKNSKRFETLSTENSGTQYSYRIKLTDEAKNHLDETWTYTGLEEQKIAIATEAGLPFRSYVYNANGQLLDTLLTQHRYLETIPLQTSYNNGEHTFIGSALRYNVNTKASSSSTLGIKNVETQIEKNRFKKGTIVSWIIPEKANTNFEFTFKGDYKVGQVLTLYPSGVSPEDTTELVNANGIRGVNDGVAKVKVLAADGMRFSIEFVEDAPIMSVLHVFEGISFSVKDDSENVIDSETGYLKVTPRYEQEIKFPDGGEDNLLYHFTVVNVGTWNNATAADQLTKTINGNTTYNTEIEKVYSDGIYQKFNSDNISENKTRKISNNASVSSSVLNGTEISAKQYSLTADIDPNNDVKRTDIISETSVFATLKLKLKNAKNAKEGNYVRLYTKNFAFDEGSFVASDGTVVATLNADAYEDNYNGMIVAHSRNTDRSMGLGTVKNVDRFETLSTEDSGSQYHYRIILTDKAKDYVKEEWTFTSLEEQKVALANKAGLTFESVIYNVKGKALDTLLTQHRYRETLPVQKSYKNGEHTFIGSALRYDVNTKTSSVSTIGIKNIDTKIEKERFKKGTTVTWTIPKEGNEAFDISFDDSIYYVGKVMTLYPSGVSAEETTEYVNKQGIRGVNDGIAKVEVLKVDKNKFSIKFLEDAPIMSVLHVFDGLSFSVIDDSVLETDTGYLTVAPHFEQLIVFPDGGVDRYSDTFTVLNVGTWTNTTAEKQLNSTKDTETNYQTEVKEKATTKKKK